MSRIDCVVLYHLENGFVPSLRNLLGTWIGEMEVSVGPSDTVGRIPQPWPGALALWQCPVEASQLTEF